MREAETTMSLMHMGIVSFAPLRPQRDQEPPLNPPHERLHKLLGA